MAVLLVVSVVQLGIQATAARRISADPEHVAQIEREVLRLSATAPPWWSGGLLLLADPADRPAAAPRQPARGGLRRALPRSRSPSSAASSACCRASAAGGRWRCCTSRAASPGWSLGTALILWRPTELRPWRVSWSARSVPVVLGVYALRRDPRRRAWSASTTRRRPIAREILGSSQTLLAFLVLMNCDVDRWPATSSTSTTPGCTPAGLILTKAMLFLPQFVVVVAFPSMATAHERRRALFRGLTFILVLGAAGVLACALLPGLALVFVGGAEYAEIRDLLWLFAVLGTVLSPAPAARVRRAGPPGHPLGRTSSGSPCWWCSPSAPSSPP